MAERRREELNRYIRHLTHEAPEVAEVGGLSSVLGCWRCWGGVGWGGMGWGGVPPGGQGRDLALRMCLTLRRRRGLREERQEKGGKERSGAEGHGSRL